VPPDRVDGKQLRYALRDGKPVVYSVGRDHVDDGGRPPENREDSYVTKFGPRVRTPGEGELGDWLFWPPAPVEDDEDDAPPAETDESQSTSNAPSAESAATIAVPQ